jgi:ATP-dependent helicase/DNAse subunit B
LVTSVEVYNWGYDPLVRLLFENSYNDARKVFLKGPEVYTQKTTVKGKKSFGYFEIDRASTRNDVYEFRISENNLKKIESTKKQISFNNMFEVT